jgi:hypothetical protein
VLCIEKKEEIMTLGNVRNTILNGDTAIAPSVNRDTDSALKDAKDNANAQSGASAAMNQLTQSLIANQLAHSINKAVINNAKTVAQQYLSIA